MLYDRKLFYHPSLIMRHRLFRIISHSFFGRDFYHVSPPTVGYGDITPETPLGRFLSAIVMLLGYTIIAVPTGIVSASMIQEHRRRVALKCPHCGKDGHEDGAAYCKYCGGKLVN
jgi:voltage-gated potassium channel